MTPDQYFDLLDRLNKPGARTVRQWDDRHEDWHDPPDDADLESLEFRPPMYQIVTALPAWARHVAADAAFRWALTKVIHAGPAANTIAELSHELRSQAVDDTWAIARIIVGSAPDRIRAWLAGGGAWMRHAVDSEKWLAGWLKQVRGRLPIDSILIRSSRGERVQIPEIQPVQPLPQLGPRIFGADPITLRLSPPEISSLALLATAPQPYFSIEITGDRFRSDITPRGIMPTPEPSTLNAGFDASGVPRFNTEVHDPAATIAPPIHATTTEEADAPNRRGAVSRGPRSAKRRGRTSRARRGVD